MSGDILVSVIVPVYKVEKYLSQCLDSIRRQNMTEMEIICVYTDSPDSSLEILDKYPREDVRFRIVRRDDGGLGGARNFGLSFAGGEYIAFVDSDDWLGPDMLSDMYANAKLDDADLVICGINSYDDAAEALIENDWGYNLPFPDSLEGKSFRYVDIEPDEFISAEAPVVAWNKLYRRAFLEENSLKFPENIRYEDNLFYYEAMLKAQRVRFTRQRHVYYRKNRKGSLQYSSINSKNMFDIVKILAWTRDMLNENKAPVPVKEALAKYTLEEFCWRYFSITGAKREFLQAICRDFPTKIYAGLISTLKRKGASASIIEGAAARMVKVSVIIPIYNAEKYIAECLDSVLSQKLTDIEVICVDDKSTDATRLILASYAERDSRIILFDNNENSGAGVCRDTGIKAARGEFVFFLDADDLLPDKEVLWDLFQACAKNEALTCAGNIVQFHNNNRNELFEHACIRFDKTSKFAYTDYKTHPTWGFTRFLFNLEMIWENNIGFNGLRYYEDPYFFVHYMSVAKTFMALNRTVYLYRIIEDKHSSLSAGQLSSCFASLYAILKILKEIDLEIYYKEYLVFLDFSDQLRFIGNHGELSGLIALCNKIFKNMDFSKYKPYLAKNRIFHSYEELTRDNNETAASPSSAVKNYLKTNLKRILRPLYRRLRYSHTSFRIRNSIKNILKALSLRLFNRLRRNQPIYSISPLAHNTGKAAARLAAFDAAKFVVEPYQIRALGLMVNDGYDFAGKRVLEIGGSNLPRELTLDCLRADQWVCVDYLPTHYAYKKSLKHYSKELTVKFSGAIPLGRKDYIIIDGRVEDIPPDFFGFFDVVVSFCAFEHFADVPRVLQIVKKCLKRDEGDFFTFFGPIWSCGYGHHCWVTPQLNFNVNMHLPEFSHLLLEPHELENHLSQFYPPDIVKEAGFQIYASDRINRLFYDDYVKLFKQANFDMCEIKSAYEMPVAASTLNQLEKKYPQLSNFTTYNVYAHCKTSWRIKCGQMMP